MLNVRTFVQNPVDLFPQVDLHWVKRAIIYKIIQLKRFKSSEQFKFDSEARRLNRELI